MREISCEELLTTRDVASFTGASVFGALPEPAIQWLLERGKIHDMEPGEYLFSPGEPGNSFHVILVGRVSYHKYHLGKFGFIREYTMGEQIGFMSLIALHERVGRVECNEPTIALEIDSHLFHEFHDEKPADFGILMLNLAREMARTLRMVDNLLVEKS